MVHIAEGGRSSDRWSQGGSQARSLAAGLVLVGMTGAVVLSGLGAVSWDQAGVGAFCLLALGTAVAVGILYRLRVARTGGGEDGATLDVPPVTRRNGTSIQNDARRHRRFVPARRATVLHIRDGRQIAARIVDISIAGVAIEARLTDIEFLSVARVGSQAAGPVRRTPTGAVFGFDRLLDPQPFDASFVL